MRGRAWIGVVVTGAVALVGSFASTGEEHALEVTATAYNSLKSQGQGDPTIAAWGDVLKPGMKVIAVSRDLIPRGLRHGTVVKIDGLPGSYRVLDKLARRWKKRIDVYMGEDVAAARKWGKRRVTIRWNSVAAPDGS
jgi:3D (Asp-Asp-Asp) domain-containing protein